MDQVRILAYVMGTVDQELPAPNEYLAAEKRILKAVLVRTSGFLEKLLLHCDGTRIEQHR